jgi:glucose-6-phosphate 1-epimerase
MTTPIRPGNGFLPKIQLATEDGAHAEIYLHGAHVTSWIPAGGTEKLFLSPKSEFRGGTAIRGGVPVVFPQFSSTGPLPKHGFARIFMWELVKAEKNSATFRLADSAASRQFWPFAFQADYEVRIGGNRLEMSLSVDNRDKSAFIFTAALHTYLRVNYLADATVVGLSGLTYQDSANGNFKSAETTPQVRFPGEVDRIYFEAQQPIHLLEKGTDTIIQSEGFTDAVIWNPGSEKCIALKDMQPNGYLQFVCVESAAVGSPVHLEPGATWRGTQRLAV